MINKWLIRYKVIDYIYLMIFLEELFFGCIIDCVIFFVVIFLRNIFDSFKIIIDKVDEFYLIKLFKIFFYFFEFNFKKYDEKI